MTPAAEAIWKRFILHEPSSLVRYNDNLAAAIEELADQVVPEEICRLSGGMRPGGTGALSVSEAHQDQRMHTRRRILRIAAELRS